MCKPGIGDAPWRSDSTWNAAADVRSRCTATDRALTPSCLAPAVEHSARGKRGEGQGICGHDCTRTMKTDNFYRMHLPAGRDTIRVLALLTWIAAQAGGYRCIGAARCYWMQRISSGAWAREQCTEGATCRPSVTTRPAIMALPIALALRERAA